MKSLSDSLLSNLTPAQRCSVIFSALSREDHTEAHRLADTAPTAIYAAGDFYNPFTRAMLTAALARGDIEQATAQEWANRCFWVTKLHSEGIDDPSLDTFWSAATESRDRARSLWSAFAEAVTDAGMEPAEVMASMGGLSKLAQGVVDDERVDADPDALELYTATLRP